MSATILFRIASVVFLLFALGHTFGFLTFKPPTAEGLAVKKAMSDVEFKVGESSLSYGRFYRGFGLSCTMSMLFSAILCWQLGALATVHSRAIARCGMVVVRCSSSWRRALSQIFRFAASNLFRRIDSFAGLGCVLAYPSGISNADGSVMVIGPSRSSSD
jgi:hypothetical protein